MRITVTGFKDINQPRDGNDEQTVDLEDVLAQISRYKVANVILPQMDDRNEYSGVFADVSRALQPSNEFLNKDEAHILKRLVEADLDDISVAYTRLQKRTQLITDFENTVNRLKDELIVLYSMKESLEFQRTANISGQEKLLSVFTYSTNNLPLGESNSGADHVATSHLYNNSISKLKAEKTALDKEGDDITLRIKNTESQLVAAETARLGYQERACTLFDHIVKLKTQVDGTLRRFSVALQLPSEVMCRIFDAYIQDQIDQITRKRKGHKVGRGVVFLASICRGWRRLVYASPELWRYVPIAPRSLDDPPEIVINEIGFYLTKALPTKPLIFHWSPQWHELRRDHPLYVLSPKNFFTSSLFDRVPNLISEAHTVELVGYKEQKLWPQVQLSSVVTELRIQNFDITPSAETLGSIQTLCIDNTFSFSNNHLRTLFNQLLNLSVLHLRLGSPIKPQDQWPPIVMSRLTTLAVSMEDLGTLLVGHISAPILRHVILKMYLKQSTPPPLDSVISSGVADRVIHLDISGALSSAATLNYFLPFLKLCINTETLELRGRLLTPIIKELTTKDLLPQLQHLVLRSTEVSGDAIKSLVESRTWIEGSKTITAITIDRCRNITRDLCETLEGLVQDFRVYC